MSTALAQRQNQAIDNVRRKMLSVKDRLFEGAPRHVAPERLITTALFAIRDNPQLLDCTIESLLASVRQAAFHGWELGGPLSQCYIVPFAVRGKKEKEATLIPGYRGLLDLVRRTGEVTQVDMEAVHRCDRFRVQKGDESSIIHEPSDDPKRLEEPITHVYVIVHFKNGGKQRSVWTSAEIDHHKETYSQGWKTAEQRKTKDSPWHSHWLTMAKKTVLVDMVKRGLLPTSGEIRDMVYRDEAASQVSVIDPGRAPDAEQVSYDDHQAAAAEALAIESQPEPTGMAEQVEKVKRQIDECRSLQQVTDTVAEASTRLPTEVMQEVEDYADVARDGIRETRGEKTNKRNGGA